MMGKVSVVKVRSNLEDEIERVISLAGGDDVIAPGDTVLGSPDREEILAFLERRGLAENAWLISCVFDTLQRREMSESVVICRLREELVGVAWILDRRKIPAEDTDFNPGRDYDVRMDAVDREAVEALIEAVPTDQLGSFDIFRPMIQEYFGELRGAARMEGDLYFTVSPECFRPVAGEPVAGEEVVGLTAADAGLFEGCERQRRWEHMGEEHRVFGIVRDGRAATSTGVAPITPDTGTTRRGIAISGLHTETRYRRMGLGKRLVSYVTDMILREGHAPIYWTEPENTASQALAKGLGYWQVGQEIRYLWRKA